MCGINGITRHDEKTLEKMTAATAHRGPDATCFFHNEKISFGHNRLAVIDLSASANQPMHSEDGRFTMLFNGEIYNYRELREELKDVWHFRSAGDSEVLLAGYVHWGKTVFSRVKGIFACALYDNQKDELYLVRDHMGVKPLYYALQDGVLYFSSELGGIIEGTGKRKLNHDALAFYITLNYVPSPETLVLGIKKLQPGHALTYKNGVLTTERYFTCAHPTKNGYDTKAVYDIIDAGVLRQLVSDRPLGVFLSGGLDSSIVLHHASKHLDQIKTFSVDFEMAENAPESERVKFNTDALLAKKTAAHYNATHTTFTLGLDAVRTFLPEALACLDEPVANPTSVSQYLLSKWVREKGIVVALGGDGGDELFGGYTRHRIARASWLFQKAPVVLQKTAGLFSGQLAKLSVPFGPRFHMQVLALKEQKYTSVFPHETGKTSVFDFFKDRYAANDISSLPAIDTFMRVDRETWLADESLARTDRTSMAFGVEARVPLLDIDIVEFADGLLGASKYTLRKNKKILRDTYRQVLPSYLFTEPKRGWLSPGSKWFRDPIIKKYVGEALSSSYYKGLDSVLNWNEVQKMFEHHTDGGGYHLYPLWNILQLQVWAEKYKIVSE